MANLVKVDRNGTKYYEDIVKCDFCNGSGYISYYQHYCNGVCFQCSGTGRKFKKWKEYTPQYQAKLDAKKIEKFKKHIIKENEKFYKENAFDENGYTYIVLGNTYPIKEQLKQQGAKYSTELGWHFVEEKENTMKVHISEVTQTYEGAISFKAWYEVKEYIEKKKKNV